MSQVRIIGAVNTVYLREGEAATVEHTDRIDRLAKAGMIRVLGSVAREPSPGGYNGGSSVEQLRADEQVVTADEIAGEPPKSGKGATRARWAEWLDANGIPVDDEDTKNDLIEKWMNRHEV